ncbi:MurR/RpiR family transcriptional regulator [Halomonas qinghailakensis]|uniref:MurR/RpiR family transcriptional regulator n=2 Tax=Halomonas TaxID=2745 RepID=A0AA46TMN7_9GAMM|nr:MULTISPECIES: MurR/RpiR family transcriptional regulator [Halomonas]UYO73185.1 MurR/RpiR family transcriptional regulator [Halomonas sp. ZZQ-149]UYV18704.1 MurR/RpiR family transcriptional regulator [Halomonas qaidamensis]
MNAKKTSFVTLVKAALPTLHPTERRLAEFILNFPGELASYTATELANLAGVSNATITRFVKKLGYRSFEEARQHVRDNREEGAALLRVEGHEDDRSDSLLYRHIHQGIKNLEHASQHFSQSMLDEVANAMLSARKVWVVGFRSSHPFAEYLNWQIMQVIENTALLPRAGETLAESLVSMTSDDCVILFGLKRRTADLDTLLTQIASSHANVLYITDESAPENNQVSWHAVCRTAAPGPLFNHVAVLSMCHFLATRVIELSGAEGRHRMTSIEAIHEALDELQ